MPTKKNTGLEQVKAMLDFAGVEYRHEPAVEPLLVVRGKNGSEVRMTFDSDGDLKAVEGIGGEYSE
jgi:hypothetical protein